MANNLKINLLDTGDPVLNRKVCQPCTRSSIGHFTSKGGGEND